MYDEEHIQNGVKVLPARCLMVDGGLCKELMQVLHGSVMREETVKAQHPIRLTRSLVSDDGA